MEFWLWVVSGIAISVFIAMFLKIRILKKSAREIEAAFEDRLMTETNTLIDISSRDRDLRSLADAVNRQLRELYRQRKLYSMGDTELKNAVTSISHDLRTPLTAICGYFDLLENEKMSAEAERYLAVVRNRTKTLRQMTEELFKYSTAVFNSENEKPLLVQITLNSVLEESIAAFYAVFKERGIEPVVNITERKIIRRLDPVLLSRIFLNILSNALKYSDGDLEISMTDHGDISFVNTARGLDKIQTEQLFERFYTVETAGKSTGLCLSIARLLTERMKGDISAEYNEGKLFIGIKFFDESFI